MEDKIYTVGEFLQMAYKLAVLTDAKGLQILNSLISKKSGGGSHKVRMHCLSPQE